MADLVDFINRDDLPAVAQAAIAHAQFETIHPFVDGNGRVGRCLIHVVLRRRDVARSFVPPVSTARRRAELLATGRGAERQPGEFRTSQNWIGPEGGTLANARFVPPPPHEMNQALDDLEKYLHAQSPWPFLIDLAMVHAQFETIHPFLHGNGRVGRLLVTFMLVQRQVLGQPLLYLSYYLRLHRTEYYDRLMAVREQGDWEGWIRFFLDGVRVTAGEATQTAARIIALQERHRHQVADFGGNALKLLDHLFQQPLVNINAAKALLEVSFPTAAKLVSSFEELGVLEEMTGYKRNRVYRYTEYLGLFSEPTATEDSGDLESTESVPEPADAEGNPS